MNNVLALPSLAEDRAKIIRGVTLGEATRMVQNIMDEPPVASLAIPVSGGYEIDAHIGSESIQFVLCLGLDMSANEVTEACKSIQEVWLDHVGRKNAG